MKGRLHRIKDDLGATTHTDPCDAWLIPWIDVLVWEIQRSRERHEAFQRYLRARGE